MDKIHHQHHKKAQKMGVMLEPKPEYGLVEAFWPQHNLRVYGQDARWALEQMAHVQHIIKERAGESVRFANDPAEPTKVHIWLNDQKLTEVNTPAVWATKELMDYLPVDDPPVVYLPGERLLNILDEAGVKAPEGSVLREIQDERANITQGAQQYIDAVNADAARDFHEDRPRTKDGIPTNGREAHQKGYAIPDNPFIDDPNEDAARAQWEEEWEASAEEAANAALEASEEEKPSGSVVKIKYRAIYAERGHPAHCGDELAVKLNNLVLNGSKTDIEYFKMILDANGVDMAKYKTTGNGWQGRYRMTGRNMLAKKVHAEGGVLKLPNGDELHMSAEWMAAQRFK